MANKTPSLKLIKMEELMELFRSNPGLYNQTKKIHKDQIWTKNVWQKISKKLDVKRMTGRPIYIAQPSGRGSKLTHHTWLKCYSRYKPIAHKSAINLTQYPDRD